MAGLLFTVLFFMSQVLPARGKFKEVCERPNGSCRKFCLKREIHVGRCLNGRRCCLPMGHQQHVHDIPPKKH
nr:PREDICTED: putative beta-defensin 108A [Rhinolophus sinicus]